MTLTEYINQADPKRNPVVFLEESEYEIHGSINVGVNVLTSIEIPVIRKKYGINSCYIQRNGDSNLWTQDEHGNPKSRSCFYIKSKRP